VPQGRIEVLELGSGTGYATERLLKHNPRARVTCLDLSAEMLAVASAKPALKRVRFVQGDIRDGWPSQRFDAVFTTLCLHHLTNRERLAAVRRVFGSLRRGGCFINGDVFQPDAIWEERLLCNRWFDYMRSQGMAPSDARAMLAKRRANQSCLDTMHGWRSKLQQAGFFRIFNPLTVEFYAAFVAYK
jgi:SAM-dependent methyltransferase